MELIESIDSNFSRKCNFLIRKFNPDHDASDSPAGTRTEVGYPLGEGGRGGGGEGREGRGGEGGGKGGGGGGEGRGGEGGDGPTTIDQHAHT